MIDYLASFWNAGIAFLPNILIALLAILAGYFIGLIAGKTLSKLVEKLKVDVWLGRIGRANAFGGMSAASLAGLMAKWWVFLVFLGLAASILQLGIISTLLGNFIAWTPRLLIAVATLFLGFIAADFAADEVAKAVKTSAGVFLGNIARMLAIAFFALYALREIGLNVFLAETTFLIIVAGIVLALAIGFGLGLKSHAEQIIGGMRKGDSMPKKGPKAEVRKIA